MNKAIRLAAAAGAGGLGLLLAAAAAGSGRTVAVAVVARPVQTGAVLTAADIRTVRAPAALARQEGWLAPAGALGQAARQPLAPGMPIPAGALVAKGAWVAPGMAAVSLPLSAAQAGPVAPGDRVAVLRTGNGGSQAPALVATGVPVLRVEGLGGGSGPLGGGQQGIVTLEVPGFALPLFAGSGLQLAVEPLGVPLQVRAQAQGTSAPGAAPGAKS